jgi:hypothetical protein
VSHASVRVEAGSLDNTYTGPDPVTTPTLALRITQAIRECCDHELEGGGWHAAVGIAVGQHRHLRACQYLCSTADTACVRTVP